MAHWGVAGKCGIYSMVGRDTSLFLSVDQGPSLENRLQGARRELNHRLSQRRNAVCRTKKTHDSPHRTFRITAA